MHEFTMYHRHLNQPTKKATVAAKKIFLSKYTPWVRRVFITLEDLMVSILRSAKAGEIDFNDKEISYFNRVMKEMEACEIETEIEGMLVAITKLTKLQVRVWTRVNKALS